MKAEPTDPEITVRPVVESGHPMRPGHVHLSNTGGSIADTGKIPGQGKLFTVQPGAVAPSRAPVYVFPLEKREPARNTERRLAVGGVEPHAFTAQAIEILRKTALVSAESRYMRIMLI
jgi:hypothetical protein